MTINEIARMAGVSRATVSRYLNKGYVSDEKREQIRKVIEETGYEPSNQAKMLRMKKTNLIGVIIPKINSESVSRMVSGISSVLTAAGYQLLLANTDNNENEELKYLSLFKCNHVDGVILIGTIITKAHVKALKEMQVPVVILGQVLTGFSCVYHDDYNAARELAQLMCRQADSVGFIGVTSKDVAAGMERRRGFLDGIGKSAVYCVEGAFSMEAGYHGCRTLLGQHPEITGFFCVTDTIAAGAMAYLHELEKKIPEEIVVIGVGDSVVSKVTHPTITTVHYYYKTSGIEAARMLLDRIIRPDEAARELKMGYQLIQAGSTKA